MMPSLDVGNMCFIERTRMSHIANVFASYYRALDLSKTHLLRPDLWVNQHISVRLVLRQNITTTHSD